MRDWFSLYGKALALVLGAVAMVIQTLGWDTTEDKIAIGIALVGGIVTYVVPNLTGGIAKFAKAITSAAMAVFTGLSGWLIDGMSTDDWVNLLIAALVAAGVLILPSVKHEMNPAVA